MLTLPAFEYHAPLTVAEALARAGFSRVAGGLMLRKSAAAYLTVARSEGEGERRPSATSDP